jgi:hypothetical protein
VDENRVQRSRMGVARWWARRWAFIGALLMIGLLVVPATAGAAGVVKCTPNNAPVGTSIGIGVTGLTANQAVTVTSSGPTGVVAKSNHTTDANGALDLTYDTTGDAVGAYTVQVLDATNAVLAQGAYTLTAAAPGSLPATGGGFAAQAGANVGAGALVLGMGMVALLLAYGYVARRRRMTV